MAETRDCLVEIGTEELPPKALPRLAEAFRAGVESGLSEHRLEHEGVESFATPRRLAVRVRRLAAAQAAEAIEKRGPPVAIAFDDAGRPTRAATAFAAGCGTTVDALERITTPKGEWLVWRTVAGGEPVTSLLPGIVERALGALPVPKRMRWGAGEAEFVRPVHWLVALYGDDVVPMRLYGQEAGRVTRGHRFMGAGTIELAAPEDYESRLEAEGRVVVDFAERRARVLAGAERLAAEAGGALVYQQALLDEVAALVEWPVPLAGRLDERFLSLPPEVLIATLQDHQRYFPVRGADGALLPRFVAVANIESTEPDRVREGNERVVRPRLADAGFFYDQDRRRPLADRVEGLGAMVFEQRLGSLAEKSARVAELARSVAATVGADTAQAARAATLAKCDLLTEMVGEFPQLQGLMGRYYAAHDGEPADVAAAIEEQYRPRYAGDALPETATGRALAIADRLDTLAGIFAIGQKPTGNRDPFGLRRAAIGLLRILIEERIDLDLVRALGDAARLQPVGTTDDLVGELYEFVMERLRAYYLEGGGAGGVEVTTERFDAVLATRPRAPVDFHLRLLALGEFLDRPEAARLAAANKRVANILKKSGADAARAVDDARLVEPAERTLAAGLAHLSRTVEPALERRDYPAVMAALAGLSDEIDGFFDEVMVVAEDPALRGNRLALLADLRALYASVADLSRLPGSR